MFEKRSEHISPKIFGEITPTVGKSLNAAHQGYDGVILIGPLNCLPFRISEAIQSVDSWHLNIEQYQAGL